jgi:hypothetical protein
VLLVLLLKPRAWEQGQGLQVAAVMPPLLQAAHILMAYSQFQASQAAGEAWLEFVLGLVDEYFAAFRTIGTAEEVKAVFRAIAATLQQLADDAAAAGKLFTETVDLVEYLAVCPAICRAQRSQERRAWGAYRRIVSGAACIPSPGSHAPGARALCWMAAGSQPACAARGRLSAIAHPSWMPPCLDAAPARPAPAHSLGCGGLPTG